MMQVADGMHFLAKSNVVHCNLSLANVWVGQTNTAKVANFIAARRMELQGSRMCYRRTDHAVVVNFKWQSPEVSLSLTLAGSTACGIQCVLHTVRALSYIYVSIIV